MGRLLPRVLVAALVLWVANSGIAGQQSAQPNFAETAILRATTVEELRRWDPLITEGARAGALRIRSARVDPLMPSRVVERYEQFHNGVRIWGADVVRDSERGIPHAIFGQLVPADIQIPATPGIGGDDAHAVLLQLGGSGVRLLTDPVLVIRRLDSGDYRLAYTAVVSGNNDVVRIFIDAMTGIELVRFTEIQTQAAAVGSGRGVLGDQKKLSVESTGGGYIAFDRHRPPTIQTFDMRDNLGRAILVLQGSPPLRSELAIDPDNTWTDPSVVDAHAHVSWTYDYYYKRFQRNGLDGRNGPVNIVTNALSQTSALQHAPDSEVAARLVRNASWCGLCNGGTGVMFFGNGIPSGFAFPDDGKNYTYFSGALDVAAHELTHAVTQFTSNLEYRRESGALNEAFSDMMGKSVEFYYHPPGGAPGQADYVIGKDVVRAVRAGALNGIRSMANPRAYGDPDHYSTFVRLPDTLAGDWGGVHINSGIPNHAFYLAIEGGTNRTSGLSVQGVGAANREQVERVFYRAFTMLTPSSANFSMARIATIQAARDLYGAGGTVERAVTQAWDAVGVTNTSSFVTQMQTFNSTLPGDSGRLLYYYTVTMPETGRYQAVLRWTDPAVDLDLMIGRPGCFSQSCMLTRASSATARPETVCLNVRSGEQYNVLMQNFSSRTVAFELTQTIQLNPIGGCTVPGATGVSTSNDAGIKSGPDARSAQRLN